MSLPTAIGGLPVSIDPLALRPRLDPADARRIARDGWGIEAEATPLPGERDRNFRLRTGSGETFLLKVTAASEGGARLDLQHRMLELLRSRDRTLRLPRPVPALDGAGWITLEIGGDPDRARLFHFLEGRPLSRLGTRPPALLDAAGRFLGRLRRALRSFDHPALDDTGLPWDPRHAAALIGVAGEEIGDPDRRALYRRVAAPTLRNLPRLLSLPGVAIHNDANEDNFLLAGGEPESAAVNDLALLDFGDVLRAPAIVEAATGALYLGYDAAEPLRAARAVLAGFARERRVSEEEAELFPTGIAVRALVSAGIAALRRRAVPGASTEAYLMTSETAVWRFLRVLDAEHPETLRAACRAAAGHPPIPHQAAVLRAVRRAAQRAVPPIRLEEPPAFLNQTPESQAVDPFRPGESLTQAVTRRSASSATVIGRYREPRLPETSPADRGPPPALEPATISLGIEVFAAAGTPAAATLDGRVAWCVPEDGHRAVGIVHETEGERFWTVYRGLDQGDSCPPSPGTLVRRGEEIGRVSLRAPDGGPPRLEFQLSVRGAEGPPPRRSALRDLPQLEALSPDPGPFFRLDDRSRCPRAVLEEPPHLLAARRRRFSRALSLSYGIPIQTVRGRGALLYDAAGRDYLDMVNNVCHVGHAHPRVVEAIARQAALLNTNTRYLYRGLTDYADRLTALLPDPLEMVFFTNSGSEANDLALRIARNALGRKETVVFDGGYSGNLTSLVEISPYKLDGAGGRSAPPFVHRLPMPDGYRGRFRADRPGFPDNLIADAERRVARIGPAVLLGEAILSCGGQVVPPPGYLRAVFRAVRAAGGIVVCDEVQTGFGRVGPPFWAFRAAQEGEKEEIPDIVTLGKPAGNGHPLGAVVTTRELARSFETGMEYFNTYGGNPVSCAAGLAVLEVIREEGLPEHAAAVGRFLLRGLEELRAHHPALGDVRGRGLFLGFEMVGDPAAREPATAAARRLTGRLGEFRILNSTDGPDANVIKIKPPLVFSAADAERYLEALDFVLGEQR